MIFQNELRIHRTEDRSDVQQFLIGSWNVGGGILGESHQTEGVPDLAHHASLLLRSKPDIVCLQEAHIYATGEDQVSTLAEMCGYDFYTSQRLSPSHLAKNAHLSLGLMSKFPIVHETYTELPNPGFRNTGPNGEEWILFDKGFTVSTVKLDQASLNVVNAHHFPLHYFDVDARDPSLAYVLEPLHNTMRDLSSGPTVACIDLNSPFIDELMPEELTLYWELMDRQKTTPKGVQQDYLLGSRSLEPGDPISAVQTDADHLLCLARASVL